jgi:chromosome segregation ATPase
MSSAALVAGPGGGGDLTKELARLNSGISALDARVTSLKEDIASASKGSADASTTLSSLRKRVGNAEAEAASAKKALADLPEAAPAVAGVDDEKLGEIIKKEITNNRENREKEQADRRQRGMIDGIRDGLGVDEEKAAKVAAVQRKTWGKMRDVWRNAQGDREAAQKGMAKLWDDAETEMAEFLSEEELGKAKEWRKRMEQWGRGRGNRGDRNNRGGDRKEPKPERDDDPVAF